MMATGEGNPQRSLWQVSGGPANRDYSDILIKYGVALIGPGDAGRWRPDREDYEFEGGFVRRFASEVQLGDVFLLRTGISKVRAVGIVASEYLYLPQFDDVNGWDLQHGRRVRWCELPNTYDFGLSVFGANPPRLSKLASAEIIDYAYRFIESPPINWQSASLPSLPSEEPFWESPPSNLQDLIAQVHDLVGLYWDNGKFGSLPTEDELIAHYVVPFLRKLGWPVENIGIKWRYVDVTVFRALPRSPENCHFIIEAKRLGSGVEGALEQAKGYLRDLGVEREIVVTDGIRYRMYEGSNNFAHIAYANLDRLKVSASTLFARMSRR
jgi:hypothetical protein